MSPSLPATNSNNTPFKVCPRHCEQLDNMEHYDSKKETSYCGLKNHGATCYLNCLLQKFYHTGAFRKTLYDTDLSAAANNSDDAKGSKTGDKGAQTEAGSQEKAHAIIKELQNLFYRLQTSNTACNCRDLMKSFG
jgi:ubiquitin C-terminal hydrolase